MAKPHFDLPVLLTQQQVCLYLNTSIFTVERLIASGRLPAVQFAPRSIRVYKSDVDALLVPVTRRRADEPQEQAS